jgi:hypothetical protein
MLHVADMKEGTNDNDTWQPLSLATRRLLETCEDEKEQRERDAQRSRDEKQKKEEERAYIEQRLRDITAFEERFRPGQRSRRKRN